MISVLDTKARDAQKENFTMGCCWDAVAQRTDVADPVERGIGRRVQRHPDRARRPDAGIVVEVKYAPTFQGLGEACAKAMEQIKARRYDERLRNEGREDILVLRHCFNKKRCKAVREAVAERSQNDFSMERRFRDAGYHITVIKQLHSRASGEIASPPARLWAVI